MTAKDHQAAEANKNASILLEQIDLEKEQEEIKKAAAAKKRDKKKQKKKKKVSAEKDVETNVTNLAEKENSDDSSEPERKISENGGKIMQCHEIVNSNPVIFKAPMSQDFWHLPLPII